MLANLVCGSRQFTVLMFLLFAVFAIFVVVIVIVTAIVASPVADFGLDTTYEQPTFMTFSFIQSTTMTDYWDDSALTMSNTAGGFSASSTHWRLDNADLGTQPR